MMHDSNMIGLLSIYDREIGVFLQEVKANLFEVNYFSLGCFYSFFIK